jgi:hypothetical protein
MNTFQFSRGCGCMFIFNPRMLIDIEKLKKRMEMFFNMTIDRGINYIRGDQGFLNLFFRNMT